MSESDQREPARRIAVVAIHGVGDHEPFATAREIGDLLSNLEYTPSLKGGEDLGRALTPPRYSPFTEVTKRINVRPVKVEVTKRGKSSGEFDWKDQELQRNTWGPMDALENANFRRRNPRARADDRDNASENLDHLFMQGQLVQFKGENPEDTYQCLRLEGKRVPPKAPAGEAAAPSTDRAKEMDEGLRASDVKVPEAAPDTEEKTVHIYEMYWADLSQGSNAFTRIFGELYQLLFHLASVSVNNVMAAAIYFHRRESGKTREKWHSFSRAQRLAAAILAWPIPILNLLMAAVIPVIVVVSLMRAHLSAQMEFVGLDAVLAVLAVAGSGYAISKAHRLPGPFYSAPLLAIGAVGIYTGHLTAPWGKNTIEEISAVVLLAVTLGCVWLIVCAYEKRRPGSKAFTRWLAGLLVVVLVATFVAGGVPVGGSQGVDYPALGVCLNILEVMAGVLALAWLAFFVAYIQAHLTGWRAVQAVRGCGADGVKARRGRWTAQLILALSSFVFITLTVPIWTGVEKLTIDMLPGPQAAAAQSGCTGDACAPATYRPVAAALYAWMWEYSPKGVRVERTRKIAERAERYFSSPPLVAYWAGQMLLAPAIAFLPFLLVALLLALIITVWALFPSLVGELSPPGSAPEGASEAQGLWLDRGFRFMRWAGEIFYWIMWMPLVVALVFNFGFIDWIYANWVDIEKLIAAVGTVVAGAAVGIFGFSGRLKSFAGGLRPVLRVMLDVDNWLREHPRDTNPTARICGRYVSLLRHISAWRDSDDKKSSYDALVIVAHSQGTVITADFLRYLEAEKIDAGSMANYDPELELFDKIPLYFFSMGCPLHQLYGLRFPFLYGWARNEVSREEMEPGVVPDIDDEDQPRPSGLGVERWTNAYRSGDYVGRYLWRGGRGGYEWSPAATRYDEDWDPPAGKPAKVSADRAGSRVEFCIGPGAHTHYWDHTAEVIAEVLDRLINNARAGRIG